MIALKPIIDQPVSLGDIVHALKNGGDDAAAARLASAIASSTLCRYAFPVSSGTAALYVILKAIPGGSKKTEVVLPAYTAGSLVVAVRKAGFTPVLADISTGDFNADTNAMAAAVNDRTLAVVAVHMFGIGMDSITDLRRSLPPGVTLIEDCCQSMGSAIAGRTVGSFGDVSFLSFGRGKNLSACGGGCVMTDDGALAKSLGDIAGALPPAGRFAQAREMSKLIALSAAVNPWVYGIFNAAISRLKENAPPLDFEAKKISGFRAGVALGLLGRFREASSRRSDNGRLLARALKDVRGLRLPVFGSGDKPVFNRFPVVFDDRFMLEKARLACARAGVETSRMYRRPLHHMFDLGYGKGEFPNACLLAEGLLTLPVYPSMKQKDISRMADAIGEAMR